MKHYSIQDIYLHLNSLSALVCAETEQTVEKQTMQMSIEIINQLLKEYDGERFEKMKIVVYRDGIIPTRAHPTDAGLDLYTPVDFVIPAQGRAVIDTLCAMEIPEGYVGLITSKSGLMAKGITSRGTVDAHYRGHIRAVLFNHSDVDYEIHRGEKITQIVLLPIITPELEIVTELSQTDRGVGGFGSTGV